MPKTWIKRCSVYGAKTESAEISYETYITNTTNNCIDHLDCRELHLVEYVPGSLGLSLFGPGYRAFVCAVCVKMATFVQPANVVSIQVSSTSLDVTPKRTRWNLIEFTETDKI